MTWKRLDKAGYEYFTGPTSKPADEGPYPPADVWLIVGPAGEHHETRVPLLQVEMAASPEGERGRSITLQVAAEAHLDFTVEMINTGLLDEHLEQIEARLLDAIRRRRQPPHTLVVVEEEVTVSRYQAVVIAEDLDSAARLLQAKFESRHDRRADFLEAGFSTVRRSSIVQVDEDGRERKILEWE